MFTFRKKIDGSSPTHIFNITIQQIIMIVIEKYPKNKTIKNLQSDVRAALSFDKKMVFNMFYPYVERWRREIEAGDIEYFLNIDVKKETTESEYIKRIEDLKIMWRGLPKETQETIREKIANLYVLFA